MQGTVFQWLLDIMVVIVVFSCIYLGMRRGLVVSVLRVVSFLIAAVVAHSVSNPAAQYIYDVAFKSAVESASATSVTSFLIKSFIDPAVVTMMRVLIFVVLLIILSLIIKAALGALKIINKIPVIGQLNALLGGVVGLLYAVIWLFVISLVLSGYNLMVPNNTFINGDVISSTYLYRFIVSWNPFTLH